MPPDDRFYSFDDRRTHVYDRLSPFVNRLLGPAVRLRPFYDRRTHPDGRFYLIDDRLLPSDGILGLYQRDLMRKCYEMSRPGHSLPPHPSTLPQLLKEQFLEITLSLI
jgi:hypothetical protein